MAIQNVAIIGASGTIGAPILSALRAHPNLTPFILNRHSSKSVYPRTRIITIPDDLSVPTIASRLKDYAIDALVIAFAANQVDEQKKLIDAAFESGCVKRVIPAEFGSCDSADGKTVELLPLMEGKKRVREYAISVCEREREGEQEKLSWTSLVTGHFFDWGIPYGLLKFQPEKKIAYLLDGGDIKFSASTLSFVGEAVCRILEHEEQTRNRMLYVHSLHVTQREVLAAIEKVTGERWKVVEQESGKVLQEIRPRMLEGDFEAREEVVAVWGVVASDWVGKEGFANGELGLEEESLEEVVRRVFEK